MSFLALQPWEMKHDKGPNSSLLLSLRSQDDGWHWDALLHLHGIFLKRGRRSRASVIVLVPGYYRTTADIAYFTFIVINTILLWVCACDQQERRRLMGAIFAKIDQHLGNRHELCLPFWLGCLLAGWLMSVTKDRQVLRRMKDEGESRVCNEFHGSLREV